jgi:L-asparaginase/Glu-tRNA(Gln) amidotransferase subunit D
MLAGWLSPLKARILLWALIASGADDEAVRVLFRSRAAL